MQPEKRFSSITGLTKLDISQVPSKPGNKVFYDHAIFLKENGIYMLETMNTGRLPRAGVGEFMLVLGQARLEGAVQMVINPVAMW